MPTLRALLDQAIPRLQAAGVDTPRLDAELLLAHAIGRERLYLVAHPEDQPAEEAAARFGALLERRLDREPLPYLLGEWEWLGMRLEVGPAVLIPRPETETLVETAAARLPADGRALDVGAGSGCVAIGLARLRPRVRVQALEPSPEAAAVATRNAARQGLAERVEVVQAAFPPDAAARARLTLPVDAVVSNPPYVPSAEVERLAPELRRYEPRLALDGGPDGLSLLRALGHESPRLLRAGGFLAVEVMQGQAGQVAGLLREAGAWEEAEIIPDLAGVERIVLARVRAEATGKG